MKKKIFVILALFVSVFLLAGCNSKSNDKKVITDTKKEVEQISSEIIESNNNYSRVFRNGGGLTAEGFETLFISYARDLMINLEEKYNKGTKVFLEFNDGEVNGMKIGEDETNNRKYHIYIGSETYNEIWSYATIDLDTGNISWKDNY